MPVSTAQEATHRNYGALITGAALIALITIVVLLQSERWSTVYKPLPDFAAYEQVDEMKAAFIDYLSPIIEYNNDKILDKRNRLQNIHDKLESGRTLTYFEKSWLKQTAKDFNVKLKKKGDLEVTQDLLAKVDIIPVSLAVAQAAQESSWGRSRYAVQANNLFGQWCYKRGCGVVPAKRPKDAKHEVRKFDNVSTAIRSYIHNLNSHHKYEKLRTLRAQLRKSDKSIEGEDLVEGLLYYSEQREKYIKDIRLMLKQYKLARTQQLNAVAQKKG